MIRREYSGNARRARNYIWNAAGRYDFEPPYLAFYPTGEVDMYMSMVIGLAVRWFDMERLVAFFDSYKTSRSAGEYDEFLWLGIENCVYAKELSDRPVLDRLRMDRANEFFRVQMNLSRQQVEMQSMAVYDQQAARWSEVLGKHVLLAGKKRQMYEFLKFEKDLDTDSLLLRMSDFCETFFHFTPGVSEEKTGSRFFDTLRRGFGKRRGSAEKLIVRTGDGGGLTDKDVLLTHTAGMRYGYAPTEKDEEYIRGCFGNCLYSEEEMRILEEELCTDGDAACRLWISDAGRAGKDGSVQTETAATPKDVGEYLAKSVQQRQRNKKYREDNSLMISESIRRLSAELQTLFESYARHLPEKARAGRLVARRAYRLRVVHDPYVFLREGDETENNIRVTILLDASMSRLHSQEKIASEAYVIAASLGKIRIPVQILSYRTIRGFTVIERIKGYEEKRAESVLAYTAGGWNRDSLAFRAVGRMIRETDPDMESSHILLILTDASPNDSMPIAVSDGLFGGREYEGELSVREAERAVAKLRAGGIRTAAIFLGASAHLDNVHQIYGKEYVRISSIAQLADGVSELLAMMLREEPPD